MNAAEAANTYRNYLLAIQATADNRVRSLSAALDRAEQTIYNMANPNLPGKQFNALHLAKAWRWAAKSVPLTALAWTSEATKPRNTCCMVLSWSSWSWVMACNPSDVGARILAFFPRLPVEVAGCAGWCVHHSVRLQKISSKKVLPQLSPLGVIRTPFILTWVAFKHGERFGLEVQA